VFARLIPSVEPHGHIQALPLNVEVGARLCAKHQPQHVEKLYGIRCIPTGLGLRSCCGWSRPAGHSRAPGQFHSLSPPFPPVKYFGVRGLRQEQIGGHAETFCQRADVRQRQQPFPAQKGDEINAKTQSR